jgi:hypothetical protein
MEESESLSDIIQSPFVKGESAPVRTEAPPASPAVETKAESSEIKAEAKTEEPETKAPTRDESGRFAKTEEPKDETDGRTVALRAERERRRQLEARLKELESAKPAEKVSIFEDEEKGIAQRVAEHSRPLREANFNMSVKLARLTYKDEFEKAETAFFDSAEQDPRLYEQLRASADPGEFIFTVGTQISELGPVGGNFMKYREKVTGDLKGELTKRDEMIAALKAENERLKKGQAELASIPSSLNKGNEAAPKSTAEADDDDLKSITRFGKTG